MLGPLPAYGLYARRARRVTLQNVRLQVAAPELRPRPDPRSRGRCGDQRPQRRRQSQSGIGPARHRQQGRLRHGDACPHAVIHLPPARRLRESAHHDRRRRPLQGGRASRVQERSYRARREGAGVSTTTRPFTISVTYSVPVFFSCVIDEGRVRQLSATVWTPSRISMS